MPNVIKLGEALMETHEIRYFLAVAETLNFTQAAKACKVSQPALTRGVKSLEDKLGAGQLIHRERSNTHLTELGQMMRPYFQQICEQMEAAHNVATGYVTLSDVTLRIGLMSTIGPRNLVDFLVDFQRRYKGLTIEIIDGSTYELEEQMQRGELDVAIYSQPNGAYPDTLHAIPLFSEKFMVLLPPGHRLVQQATIQMADLNGENYLGRKSCEFYDHLRTIRLSLKDVEFHRPYVSDRDDWVQSMVLSGIGFTYSPEHAVILKDIVMRPLVNPEVVREISLITVRGRPHSPAVGAFAETARRFPWTERLGTKPAGTTDEDFSPPPAKS